MNTKMNTNKEYLPGHSSQTRSGYYTPWPGKLHLCPELAYTVHYQTWCHKPWHSIALSEETNMLTMMLDDALTHQFVTVNINIIFHCHQHHTAFYYMSVYPSTYHADNPRQGATHTHISDTCTLSPAVPRKRQGQSFTKRSIK